MKRIFGAAAAALLLAAAPAYAGGGKGHDKHHTQYESEKTSESAMGGSGQAGQTSGAQSDMAADEQQISGEVLKVAGNNIYIQHMGAAIPLELGKKTQFEGEAKSKKDIKEGEQITAMFKVKGVRNVVSSISLGESGVGGSGQPDESGTGGSGMDDTSNQREQIGDFPTEPEPQPIY